MRDRGFIAEKTKKLAIDLIESHKHLKLITASPDNTVAEAFELMEKYNISQLPVQDKEGEFTGSLTDSHLFTLLVKNKDLMNEKVGTIMQDAFPTVGANDPIEKVSALFSNKNQAVLMMDLGGNWHIITKVDVIHAIS